MTTATATFSPSGHFLATVREMFATWFNAQATAKTASIPRALTAFEEAEQLRAMANDLLSSDPAFAQDLYAAADRHEHAARA